MKSNIQIGNKVRFLNATGGGIVKRIEKQIAWVQGDDGFELPTPLAQCVVVGDNDSFAPVYQTPQELRKQKAAQKPQPETPKPAVETKIQTPSESRADMLFVERPGGDHLDLHLAFLPVSFERFSDGIFEVYLINESNYHLDFVLASQTSQGKQSLRARGTIAPDTQEFVEEISLAEINKITAFALQALPYKAGRSYEPKRPVHVSHPIESRDFMRRHAFVINPFFDEDALVFTLVQEDKRTPNNAPRKPQTPEEDLTKMQAEKVRKDLQSAQPTLEKAPEQPTVDEVDLHIEALLETSSGMTPHEKLLYQQKVFVKEMQERYNKKGKRVIFIHGKGQGVLRNYIIQTLQRQFPKSSHRDASFKEYGFGALEVTIL